MKYYPRPYADIKAIRQAAILSGTKPIPKERCHMCDRTIAARELWCSTVCASDYAAEVKDLTAV